MTIHITGLGVEGRKGVCIYECRRDRIPIGNSSYKKKERYVQILQTDTHGFSRGSYLYLLSNLF